MCLTHSLKKYISYIQTKFSHSFYKYIFYVIVAFKMGQKWWYFKVMNIDKFLCKNWTIISQLQWSVKMCHLLRLRSMLKCIYTISQYIIYINFLLFAWERRGRNHLNYDVMKGFIEEFLTKCAYIPDDLYKVHWENIMWV